MCHNQTRFACELDPAVASRLRALAGDSMLGESDLVRLAVLAYLRDREPRRPVARAATDAEIIERALEQR